ncbi:FeoB-associated Cys-rich membrane protein [Mucilaginibacter myungsuensis]|uniref:FeoB-associated Cys-rich membrane protein n=1 Tax=Mucilaginibacter myungsuensis TaxID=649104 RepID=A0A929L1B6_9SPHI|nr:FeoB-associated Cys-rich membrane protein [Mucilaginibacter myungsuensis]MBE9662295.1 FeoB-associated Cys-rich membrane protein [Mucilaginibacter myungsuensis]MDN3599268.1 FeoB-associated Cys-rich membrane protein [Mucilaginibacter myungsuensis]
MVQGIIIAVVFALAVAYIGRMFYKQLFTKKSCGGNCKCEVDFSNIGPGKTVS